MATEWYSVEDEHPTGVGGYVWVWYPNPHNPRGGNMRVQSTPIMQEMAVKPTLWAPCPEPKPPMVDDSQKAPQ